MTESNQGPATPGTAARCEICGRESWNRHAAETQNWDRPRIEASCDGEAECWLLGFERLKAENASLREELEEARNEACVRCGFPTHDIVSAAVGGNASLRESLREVRESHAKLWAERTEIIDRYTAAEQRAEAAENEVAACHESLAEIRREFAAAEKRAAGLMGHLRDVLDVFGGHSSHWDPTMRHGAGCEQCNRELPVRLAARAALHDEERSAPPWQEEKALGAADAATVSGPLPLTEAEIAKGREVWERIKDDVARSEGEEQTDPCSCGKVFLKPSWGGITDGPTWVSHRREGCDPRKRPQNISDAEWQEVVDARRVLFGDPARDASKTPPEAVSLEDAAGITDVIRGTAAQGEEK